MIQPFKNDFYFQEHEVITHIPILYFIQAQNDLLSQYSICRKASTQGMFDSVHDYKATPFFRQ